MSKYLLNQLSGRLSYQSTFCVNKKFLNVVCPCSVQIYAIKKYCILHYYLLLQFQKEIHTYKTVPLKKQRINSNAIRVIIKEYRCTQQVDINTMHLEKFITFQSKWYFFVENKTKTRKCSNCSDIEYRPKAQALAYSFEPRIKKVCTLVELDVHNGTKAYLK